MGQQQLLLIILGIIIVAIAVMVAITLFSDNAADQNRNAVIRDLANLASKAQQYYHKPTSLVGGGKSFAGITKDEAGLATLAGTRFTNNANGTYSIETAGTATEVVLLGVGKTELTDGTFATYLMTVTRLSHTPTKIN